MHRTASSSSASSNPFAVLDDPEEPGASKPKTHKGEGSVRSSGSFKRSKSRDDVAPAAKEEEDAGELEVAELVPLLRTGSDKDKERAAWAIEKAATDKENGDEAREVLAAQGAVQHLVDLLDAEKASTQEAAASAIRGLAREEEVQEAVRDNGGIPKLVALLGAGGGGVQEAVAKALVNLTNKSDANEDAVRDAGGIPRLLAVVAGGSKGARIGAAKVLANLANDEGNQDAMVGGGLVELLVDMLRSGHAAAMEAAAKCLGALAEGPNSEDHKILVADAGAIPLLGELLVTGAPAAQRTAAKALANLAEESMNRTVIGQDPMVVDVLVELHRRGTNAAKKTATAALKALSVSARNWVAIAAAGGQDALLAKTGSLKETIRALHWGDQDEQAEAAWELAELVEDEDEREAVAGAGAIAPLAHLLLSPSGEVVEAAMSAVRGLVTESPGNQVAVVEAGALPAVVDALSSDSEATREAAADALAALAAETVNQVAIADGLSIPPLVRMLREGSEGEQRATLRALHELCDDAEGFIVMADEGSIPWLVGRSGAIPPLIALLSGGEAHMSETAGRVLKALARYEEYREAMVAGGVVPALVGVLAGRASRRQVEAAAWVLCEIAHDNVERMQLVVEAGGVPLLEQLVGGDGTREAQRAARRLLAMYEDGTPAPQTPTPTAVDTRTGGTKLRRQNSLVSFALPEGAVGEGEKGEPLDGAAGSHPLLVVPEAGVVAGEVPEGVLTPLTRKLSLGEVGAAGGGTGGQALTRNLSLGEVGAEGGGAGGEGPELRRASAPPGMLVEANGGLGGGKEDEADVSCLL